MPDAAVGAVAETLKEQGLMAPQASGMTFLQARTANEVLKAQERRIRLQKLRGEVVDRTRAIALVFRLARQERDAWAGWLLHVERATQALLSRYRDDWRVVSAWWASGGTGELPIAHAVNSLYPGRLIDEFIPCLALT